jgi:hypothetical protein
MKKILPAIALLCTGFFFVDGCSGDEVYPASIAFVNEMAYIPEVDGWEKCKPTEQAAFAEDSQEVRRQWDTLYRWVQKQYTAATVRALSGWAQKQMAAYTRTPGLKGLLFVPIRARQDQKKLVFEAAADSLPVHDKTVTRYLKIYLLYDSGERKIVKVTITIRGELSE